MDFDVTGNRSPDASGGISSVRPGGEHLSICHKPPLMLLGHSDAIDQLRELATLLRPYARVSSYLGTESRSVPRAYVEHGLGGAEMLFIGLGAASCDSKHHASQLEMHAATHACSSRIPIPIALVIGARQGLGAPLVRAYGNLVRIVVSETADKNGALADLFPDAIQIPMGHTEMPGLMQRVSSLSRPIATL